MTRAPFVFGLASSAVVVALVARAYGIGSHRFSSTVEPRRGEARQAQQTSSISTKPDTKPNAPTVTASRRSLDADQSSTVAQAPSGLVDEDTSRKLMRGQATKQVQDQYTFLLEDLDLTSSETEDLISLLIEDQIARTSTPYSHGKDMNEDERSAGIAAIIGYPKLQQFLALERNLPSYAEVGHIESMLRKNGVSLTNTQRDDLYQILVVTRDEYRAMPPSVVKRDSIEYLEHRLTQIDEYERHVLELAPSALSPEQVRYLFERYQYASEQRADALEMQKQERAGHTTTENGSWWYPPTWGD